MSLPEEEELDVLLGVPQGEVFDVCIEQLVFLLLPTSTSTCRVAPVGQDAAGKIQSSCLGLAYLGSKEALDELVF